MASITSSSVMIFVTLAGSRGVCSSCAKSTVPVCFSINSALGQLTAGPAAAALTHRAKAASRENTVRFMGCTPFYVLCPILCRPPGAYTENCAGRQISPCIARGSLL
ncbi:MAG: hypothetical protein ACLR65_14165 [Christensenellales bacterium]